MPSKKPQAKPLKLFQISRKKLSRALERLNNPPQATTPGGETYRKCINNITSQLNTGKSVQPINWRHNWLNMFTTSVTSHDWDTFIKTLKLASQNHKICGLENILRNFFFGVLTHPVYKDEKTLRLLLYTIAPCRNESDIEFCIETILRAFDGKLSNN